MVGKCEFVGRETVVGVRIGHEDRGFVKCNKRLLDFVQMFFFFFLKGTY